MLADKKNEGPRQKESPFHPTLPFPNTPPQKKKTTEGDSIIAVSRKVKINLLMLVITKCPQA